MSVILPEHGDLSIAYYTIQLPRPLSGFLTCKHPELDAFLEESGATTWTLLTAWDPGECRMADYKNAEFQERLLSRCKSLHYDFVASDEWRVTGLIPDGSVLVMNIFDEQPRDLTNDARQTAFIFGMVGGEVILRYCMPPEARQ